MTLVIGGKIDPRYPEAQRLAASLGLERWVYSQITRRCYPPRSLTGEQPVCVCITTRDLGCRHWRLWQREYQVVASNAASLPEILGDAALFVAPDDVEGLARAMRTILSNPALARQLSKAGRERRHNSPGRHVPRHIALYESLMT